MTKSPPSGRATRSSTVSRRPGFRDGAITRAARKGASVSARQVAAAAAELLDRGDQRVAANPTIEAGLPCACIRPGPDAARVSVARLPSRNLAIGAEYRAKPDNIDPSVLGAGALTEDDWCDSFVRLQADPRTGPFFKNANRDRLVKQLTEQLCQESGGPCTYGWSCRWRLSPASPARITPSWFQRNSGASSGASQRIQRLTRRTRHT